MIEKDRYIKFYQMSIFEALEYKEKLIKEIIASQNELDVLKDRIREKIAKDHIIKYQIEKTADEIMSATQHEDCTKGVIQELLKDFLENILLGSDIR